MDDTKRPDPQTVLANQRRLAAFVRDGNAAAVVAMSRGWDGVGAVPKAAVRAVLDRIDAELYEVDPATAALLGVTSED